MLEIGIVLIIFLIRYIGFLLKFLFTLMIFNDLIACFWDQNLVYMDHFL